MKHLFLPLTLLLSCAVAYGADQCTNLAALFDPTIIHNVVAKYENIKRIQKDIEEHNNELAYRIDFSNKKCSNFKQFRATYEHEIITTIQSLDKMGINLNELNEEGKTALEVAFKKGSPNILTTLVELGADPTLLLLNSGFNSIKSLGKSRAVIQAIKNLPPEKQKAILEKVERTKKERETAELKKQQEAQSSNSDITKEKNCTPIVVGVGTEQNSDQTLYDKYDKHQD